MSMQDKIVEDAPFEVPNFDEKEFIRKELISFRTTLVLFFFSIAAAGITYALWMSKVLGQQFQFVPYFLVAIALGAVALRFLFRLAHIDISHWKRKEWLGTFTLYFFFWLGFFLLLVNPPITDATAPVVEIRVSPGVQSLGGMVNLGAYVADNTGLLGDSFVFCVHLVASGAVIPEHYSDLSSADKEACRTGWSETGAPAFWSHEYLPTSKGVHRVFVLASDVSRQVGEANATFEVGDPFVSVSPPRDALFEQADDAFSVRVHSRILPNLLAPQYSLDGGDSFQNFRPDPDAEKAKDGWWKTDPTYKNWNRTSYALVLQVVEQPYYLRHADARVAGGIAYDPDGPYNLTVSPSFDVVGEKDPPVFRETPYFNPANTPGLGVPVALLAICGLVVTGRRKGHA